jgi:hypothetical protein
VATDPRTLSPIGESLRVRPRRELIVGRSSHRVGATWPVWVQPAARWVTSVRGTLAIGAGLRPTVTTNIDSDHEVAPL